MPPAQPRWLNDPLRAPPSGSESIRRCSRVALALHGGQGPGPAATQLALGLGEPTVRSLQSLAAPGLAAVTAPETDGAAAPRRGVTSRRR